MKKHILSYAITALLIITPIGMLCFDAEWNDELEQRARTVFPKLPKKIRGNTMREYFEKIDKYIADDIPFRGELISFAWKYFEDAGFNDDINIVVRGKENWLFIGNNFANILDKLQGKYPVRSGALSMLSARFGQIKQLAAKHGSDFAVLLGPNKSSVYPEYLPPIIYPSSKRYITPGLEELEQNGMLVVDPTDVLIASKNQGLSYYRTDTHWNLLGGSIASSMLLERLNRPAPKGYKLVPGPAFPGGNISIAGYTNFPLSEGDNFILEWDEPFTILITKDGKTTEAPGTTVIDSVPGTIIAAFNKNAATNEIAWVYTDSFGAALSPFFNATFKEVYYLHHRDFWASHTVPSSDPPGVVITVIVERNFLH